MWADAATLPGAVFDRREVASAVAALQVVEPGEVFQVGDVTVDVLAAGHVMGAVSVRLRSPATCVVVSGDLSGPGQVSVGGWTPPSVPGCDLLVAESTYAAAGAMTPRSVVVQEFIAAVAEVVADGGRVLVPAFALGRAQEIAALLHEHLPQVPVWVDGLAREVTAVYAQHPGPDGSAPGWAQRVHVVPKGGTAAAVEEAVGAVIITTSGMMTGGPVLSWARAVLPQECSALFLVGYQDPNSPGNALLREAAEGLVDLPNRGGVLEPVTCSASVRMFPLGVHADAGELVKFVQAWRPAQVMVVHGDAAARAQLTAKLTLRHIDVVDAGTRWVPTT